jgi:VanZ family protein
MRSFGAQSRLVFVVKYWLPPLGWALLIFYISSQPLGSFTPPFVYFDKFVHAGEFGVLCLLVYRAFIRARQDWLKKRAVMFSVLFCILYGVSDEIHQMFVPMRTPDAADVLADGVGAGLSQIGLWAVGSFRFKMRNMMSVLFWHSSKTNE